MTQTLATDMHFLFDAELCCQESLVAMARPDDSGDQVGSGTGRIDGPQLRGRLRWSNFKRSQPDHCQLTLTGEIDTEDGATITFDSRGSHCRTGQWSGTSSPPCASSSTIRATSGRRQSELSGQASSINRMQRLDTVPSRSSH